ncbi:MAG: hypothetical protein AAF492_18215, partial [Verrucomicrobiota bacterium]
EDYLKTNRPNRYRSNPALYCRLQKAMQCGVPVHDALGRIVDSDERKSKAPVFAKTDKLPIGHAGTRSRRIHVGDLVHHTVEACDLTTLIDGRGLRRIDVPTRIEDERTERCMTHHYWLPEQYETEVDVPEPTESQPSLIELSSLRTAFDHAPARTWSSWFKRWELENPGLSGDRLNVFWAPTEEDKSAAWEIYIQLSSRITIQTMSSDQGDDKTALTSVYKLFPLAREIFARHGRRSSNLATLVLTFLNQRVRDFTTHWHGKVTDDENLFDHDHEHENFRTELERVRKSCVRLAKALADIAEVEVVELY